MFFLHFIQKINTNPNGVKQVLGPFLKQIFANAIRFA